MKTQPNDDLHTIYNQGSLVSPQEAFRQPDGNGKCILLIAYEVPRTILKCQGEMHMCNGNPHTGITYYVYEWLTTYPTTSRTP